MSQSTDTKSPLDAAQKIVAEMHGMSKEDQALALKFAMETLRLELHAPGTPLPAPPFHSPGAPQPAPAPSPGQVTDVESFTNSKIPQSDQQFTAVVAYFYQFLAKPGERKDAIDPETMTEAARHAKWPQAKRWAMTLNNAKNAGYLDPAGGGKFKLSPVGENLVAITLPGNGSVRPDKGGKVRKKGAPKKGKSKKTPKKGK